MSDYRTDLERLDECTNKLTRLQALTGNMTDVLGETITVIEQLIKEGDRRRTKDLESVGWYVQVQYAEALIKKLKNAHMELHSEL